MNFINNCRNSQKITGNRICLLIPPVLLHFILCISYAPTYLIVFINVNQSIHPSIHPFRQTDRQTDSQPDRQTAMLEQKRVDTKLTKTTHLIVHLFENRPTHQNYIRVVQGLLHHLQN